jgi:hypothetical protein
MKYRPPRGCASVLIVRVRSNPEHHRRRLDKPSPETTMAVAEATVHAGDLALLPRRALQQLGNASSLRVVG